MIRRIDIALTLLLTALASPGVAQTPKTGQSFDSMAQSEEAVAECVAPRAPRELHSFAYVRNGYREILRILAAESALASDTCTCRFKTVEWVDVVRALDRFETSNNPKLPFDVIALQQQADALEAELGTSCAE